MQNKFEIENTKPKEEKLLIKWGVFSCYQKFNYSKNNNKVEYNYNVIYMLLLDFWLIFRFLFLYE